MLDAEYRCGPAARGAAPGRRRARLAAALAAAVASAATLRADPTPLPPILLADASGHPASRALIARDTIRVRSGGELAVDAGLALRLLSEEDFLDRVQREYARTLPEGRAPEFAIRAEGDGAWSFVNRHGQQARIEEVARHIDPAAPVSARLVYYTRGERAFGEFESLTSIRVATLAGGRVRYDVDVLAYPRASVFRFLARHLRLVDRFFRAKTREIEALALTLCGRMAGPEAAGLTTVAADGRRAAP